MLNYAAQDMQWLNCLPSFLDHDDFLGSRPRNSAVPTAATPSTPHRAQPAKNWTQQEVWG